MGGKYRPQHRGARRARRGTALAGIVFALAALVAGGLVLAGRSGPRSSRAASQVNVGASHSRWSGRLARPDDSDDGAGCDGAFAGGLGGG